MRVGDLFDRSATDGEVARSGGTYNLVSETFYGSAAVEMTFQPGVPFRQTFVLSDVTSTSFTLDEVWTTGTVVARIARDRRRVGHDRDLDPDVSGAGRGIRFGRAPDFTATSSSITLFWSSTLFQSTEVLLVVTVYNKAP